MLKATNIKLAQIMWLQLREELRTAFCPPNYEFVTQYMLIKVQNYRNIFYYTVTFYIEIYVCSNLFKSDAV